MTTYISVHRVESVRVQTDEFGQFKTLVIRVVADNEELELTLFTNDFDLEIEG